MVDWRWIFCREVGENCGEVRSKPSRPLSSEPVPFESWCSALSFEFEECRLRVSPIRKPTFVVGDEPGRVVGVITSGEEGEAGKGTLVDSILER